MRLKKEYIIYYHTWTWVVFTGEMFLLAVLDKDNDNGIDNECVPIITRVVLREDYLYQIR